MIRFNCPNCGRPHEVHEALATLPLICKQCGQRVVAPAAARPSPAPPPAAPPPIPAPPIAPPIPARPAAKPPAANPPSPPIAPPPIPARPSPKPPAALPPSPKPAPRPDEDDDDDVLVTKPDSSPDIDFNVGGPTAIHLSDAARTRPGGLSDTNRPRPEPPGAAPASRADSFPDIDVLAPAEPEPAKKWPPAAAEEPPRPARKPTVVPLLADLIAFAGLAFAGAVAGEQFVEKGTAQVLSEAGSAAQFPTPDLLLWAAPPLLFGLVYLLLHSRGRTVGAWLRRRRRAA